MADTRDTNTEPRKEWGIGSFIGGALAAVASAMGLSRLAGGGPLKDMAATEKAVTDAGDVLKKAANDTERAAAQAAFEKSEATLKKAQDVLKGRDYKNDLNFFKKSTRSFAMAGGVGKTFTVLGAAVVGYLAANLLSREAEPEQGASRG